MAKDPLEKRPSKVGQDGSSGSAMRKKLLQTFKKLGVKP
jgi:hypothetical protein